VSASAFGEKGWKSCECRARLTPESVVARSGPVVARRLAGHSARRSGARRGRAGGGGSASGFAAATPGPFGGCLPVRSTTGRGRV